MVHHFKGESSFGKRYFECRGVRELPVVGAAPVPADVYKSDQHRDAGSPNIHSGCRGNPTYLQYQLHRPGPPGPGSCAHGPSPRVADSKNGPLEMPRSRSFGGANVRSSNVCFSRPCCRPLAWAPVFLAPRGIRACALRAAPLCPPTRCDRVPPAPTSLGRRAAGRPG